MKSKITLKTIKGKHIVTVDGEQREFEMMWDALEYVYSIHSRRARASS